ncbi:MAG: hypothetical protein ACRCZY_01225 [Phocaeicola sp.]
MTLEEITRRKEELKAEIDLKERKISSLANDFFTTSPPKTKIESVMQHVQSALWIYDGVMTGIKVVRRFQRLFEKKNKKSYY